MIKTSGIKSLIFFLLFAITGRSQTYNFKNYNTDQGLAQSQVLCIFQDSRGYMWFGTNSGGASKFDGKKFTTITKNEGLLDDVVFSILENKKHEILFGTSKGLSVFNSFSFKNFTEEEGLKNTLIFKLLDDGEKTWIGTQVGVFIYESGKITAFDKDTLLNKSMVYTMCRDKKGNMWFGTYHSGLIFYNTEKKTFKHFDVKDGLLNNLILSVAEKDDHHMLVGTLTGLNEIDGSFNIRVEDKFSRDQAYSCILKNKRGEFYFGTFEKSLLKFDFKNNSRSTFYSKINGLTNNPIQCLYKDKEGNLWVGTNGEGVFKYYSDKFVYYTKQSGLPDNYVDAVKEDVKGNLWLSIVGHGLIKINNKNITNYKANPKDKNTLPHNSVKCILPLENGSVYFGTDEGLCLFENEKFNIVKNDRFDKKYILSLTKDARDKIWIGTTEGVFTIEKGEIKEETIINSYAKEGFQFLVFFSCEDRKGNMLFGLEDGLLRFDGKKIEHFDDKRGFIKSRVSSGVMDFKGNLWFGTAEGLYFYNYKTFQKIAKPNGNGLGFITFLQKDKYKRLIIGNNNEVNILNLNDFYKNKITFKHLGKEDGLLNKESNFNAATIDKFGRILVGTVNGLEIYDPRWDVPNRAETQTAITDVKLFFGQENIFDYSEGIDSVSLLPNELILPHSKSSLTFQFIGISLLAPEKVMYKYKLEGLERNWSPAVSNPEASYPSLPPGKYTFMVKAMNNDGVWNAQSVNYSFKILPPWYKTWWFRVLMVAIVLVGIWLYITLRERKLVKEKKELEQMVEERTAEISHQKHIIEDKQQEILDSINYAQRIQRALMASDKLLNANLPQYFVFFQPKDVVSGDFYWASTLVNGQFALVTADSTGHGVPGSIMSMLNISCLNDSVEAKQMVEPKDILNNARVRVIKNLANDGSAEGGKDGMDCSLVCFDFKENKFTYSAANNPVWIARGNSVSGMEFIELEYDKMPVGKHDRDQITFTQKEFQLQKGDMVYTLTDGFPDQFGGEKGKKFMYKKLKEFLLSISSLPVNEQKLAIAKTFANWKGDLEQVDDVLIIGVKV